MEITHIGHSCFKIRGKNAGIITDPFDPGLAGLKLPPLVADCITVSHHHDDHNYTQGITGNPIVIAGPGEYEVMGVRILGIPAYHDSEKGAKRGRNTLYRIDIDGVIIVHCGDLGHLLDENEREVVSEPDILMVPVGGTYTLAGREAAQLVSSLSPKIVIPMHYNDPRLNPNVFGGLEEFSVFLKEIGKEGTAPQPKLVTTKDKLPQELTVVVLE